MSEEQLKSFLEKVKGDTSLQEKLKAASDADAVAAIAKEAGFAITAEDTQSKELNLSEDEVEGVAGGACEATWKECAYSWKTPLFLCRIV